MVWNKWDILSVTYGYHCLQHQSWILDNCTWLIHLTYLLHRYFQSENLSWILSGTIRFQQRFHKKYLFLTLSNHSILKKQSFRYLKTSKCNCMQSFNHNRQNVHQMKVSELYDWQGGTEKCHHKCSSLLNDVPKWRVGFIIFSRASRRPSSLWLKSQLCSSGRRCKEQNTRSGKTKELLVKHKSQHIGDFFLLIKIYSLQWLTSYSYWINFNRKLKSISMDQFFFR